MFPKVILILCALIAGCADDTRIELRVDDSARSVLASLPGRIGILVRTEHQMVQWVLVQGVLERPRETIKVPPRDFDSVRSTLPTRVDGYLRRPYSLSPDARYVAVGWEGRRPKTAIPQTFIILDRETNRDRAIISFQGLEALDELAWSPDSNLIAALSLTERGRFSFINVISALSGHPVRYSTYYLGIYDTNGRLVVRTKLAEDVPPGVTTLVWTN